MSRLTSIKAVGGARFARHAGFTLLELLVIVAIIGIMVTVAVIEVRTGQDAAKIKAATRDIFAIIRHARSMALVSRQPSIITYATVGSGDEVSARIETVTAKMFSGSGVTEARTLKGEKILIGEPEDAPPPKAKRDAGEDGTAALEKGGGQSIEDVLFSPVADDIVRGIRIKVIRDGETVEGSGEAKTKSKISVFSNVDYLIGRLNDKKKQEDKSDKDGAAGNDAKNGDKKQQENDAPVSIVWEVNGRVEPHSVWVYADGRNYDDGMCIRIDRFGAAKISEEEP